MHFKAGVVVAVLVVIAAAFFLAASSGGSQASDEPAATCCFTHPDHAGICEVEPGEDETCASILDYLNTPMSVGKTYCAGTKIRGGWTTAACEE